MTKTSDLGIVSINHQQVSVIVVDSHFSLGYYYLCHFQSDDFRLSNLFKLKELCNEYRAACSVTERQYGSIYQYIIQEMGDILRHELLFYQLFSIKM